MTDNRRGGLTEDELDLLADKIASRMTPAEGCKLTSEQQAAVIDLITTKKKVVRWTLYVVGAMILWILKDLYLYAVQHITWGK